MGISAVYGTGIYNQSRYGWVYLSSQSEFSFLSSADLIGNSTAKGTTTFDFLLSGDLTQGIVGSSSVKFSSIADLSKGLVGNSNLVFTLSGDLSFDTIDLSGETSFEFNTQGLLKGEAVLIGDTLFKFQSEGKIWGIAETSGRTDFEFIIKRAITNAKRMSGMTDFSFDTDGHLIFTNTNPYYSTWNGKYQDLSTQNNPSTIGYLGLLFKETNGPTPLPYIETES